VVPQVGLVREQRVLHVSGAAVPVASTSSVSNLGMYGTREFSAIINPPQSGIFAADAAKPRPVVIDGSVTAATVVCCTLSVDHHDRQRAGGPLARRVYDPGAKPDGKRSPSTMPASVPPWL
jgi:hypothetical protein